MRGLGKLTWIQLKLFIREPAAFFFTLAFPAILLLIMGPIFGRGNEGIAGLMGFGVIDMMVPGFTGVIVASVSLMGLPIATAAQRDNKVLKRFHSSPVRPIVYIISDVVANLLTTTGGMLILVLLGLLLFNLRLPDDPLFVIVAFFLSSLSFFALGYLAAALSPTSRVAQVIGNILFFPMIFLSGATYPLYLMPDFMKTIAEFMPMTHVVRLLQAGWRGQEWGAYPVAWIVVTGVMVVCTLLATRLFRWE